MTKQKIELRLSPDVMRAILNFAESETITLKRLAKLLKLDHETLVRWSQAGAFPTISQGKPDGWRFISRAVLLEWFKSNGQPNADQYANYRPKYLSTRELGDELGLRPERILDYVNRGIIKPIDKEATYKQYTIDQVETLKAYLDEQQVKEQAMREHDKGLTNRVWKSTNQPKGDVHYLDARDIKR